MLGVRRLQQTNLFMNRQCIALTVLLYRVDCDDCGAPRIGRKQDGSVEPLDADCPVCSSTEYTVLANESAATAD